MRGTICLWCECAVWRESFESIGDVLICKVVWLVEFSSSLYHAVTSAVIVSESKSISLRSCIVALSSHSFRWL